MREGQYIVTGGDESYTYPSLIKPVIDFIETWKERNNKDNATIWCPFDLRKDTKYNDIQMFESNYVKIFTEAGFDVIASHIAKGKDFFDTEPKRHYDLIISNPPFQNKRLFFERALSLNKPFALVTTASWLNDGGLYSLFAEDKMQLLMPDKRSKFFNENGCIGKSPSFKSIYICKDFLFDGDIRWFELDKSHDS